jgi:tetratricopeptide (TPR) repeat protein
MGAWQSSANKWNAAITEARNQGDELDEAVALRGLGSTWLDAGIPARAEPLLRRALSLLKANPSAPGEQTASALLRLGDLYLGENKLRLAEEAYTESLKLNRLVLGEDHPQTGRLLEDLAMVYSLRGDIAMARDLAAQSADLMSRAMGAGSLPVASSLSTQAFVETQAKDLGAASEFYRRALEIARLYPGTQRMELMLIERYSAVMQAMHRGREADALKSEAKTLTTYFKASQLR